MAHWQRSVLKLKRRTNCWSGKKAMDKLGRFRKI